MTFIPYKILSHIVSPIVASALMFSGKKAAKSQRLGYLPQKIKQDAPFDLWMHGVSVGEIGVVKAIYDEFKIVNQDSKIIVSSFTDTGVERAGDLFKNIPVIYYPVDIPWAVKRSVLSIRPKIYCVVETELWPNLLFYLKKQKTKLILLNGRLSPTSFNRYKKISFFIKEVLELFDQLCVISVKDKERFISLGAKEEKISICGNAKFESLLKAPSIRRQKDIQKRLPLISKRPIIVAGSVRGKEYVEVISALFLLKKSGLNPILILVPRHLERINEIERFLREKGLLYKLFSKIDKDYNLGEVDCILIDKIGILFDLYSLCDFAFVGGTLISKGGQNLMEPASWQRPVVFGPYFYNFQDAGELLLERGGGFLVKSMEELYEAFKMLLEKRDLRVKAGINARKALEELGRGAANNQARILHHFLRNSF